MRNKPALWILSVLMGLSGLASGLSEIGEIVATPAALIPTAAPIASMLSPDLSSQSDAVEQLIMGIYTRVSPAVVLTTAHDYWGEFIRLT